VDMVLPIVNTVFKLYNSYYYNLSDVDQMMEDGNNIRKIDSQVI